MICVVEPNEQIPMFYRWQTGPISTLPVCLPLASARVIHCSYFLERSCPPSSNALRTIAGRISPFLKSTRQHSLAMAHSSFA